MAKSLFSGWKKFSTNGKNTIMAHPSGHKMIIQHKHLKAEHLEQLHALPFAGQEAPAAPKMAKGGEVERTQELIDQTESPELAMMIEKEPRRQSNPKLEESKKQPQATPYAEGGAIKKENYSEGFKKEYPGVVYDTETPTADWKEANRPQDTATQPIAEVVKAEPEYDPTQDAQINHQPKKMADGGEVADIPDASPAPVEAQPAPAPAPIDPELQQKREIYNHLVSTPTGRGFMASPDKSFGPSGEAPKQFDAGAWRQAQTKFGEIQQSKIQENQQQAASTVEENQARQAAGLAPLPVPAATAAAKQDPALQTQVAQVGTAPTAPSDPYGTQAFSDTYTKGVGEQKAGLQQEAAAQTQMGNEQAATLQHGQEVQQAALQNYQTHYQNLENERQSLISDINNQHIDPQHFVHSMDGASKIATAIGLIAGGIGGGITHTENPALQYLNAQIDRDINAQKANLGKSENLLSANMKQFSNMRDATDMTRVMQTDILSNQLKQEAAKASGPMAKARLLQAAGALDQQTAPVLSQIAMRKTLINAAQNGHIPPSRVIDMIVPEHLKGEAQKQLKEAQNDGALRDNTLAAFDQIAKLDTIMGTFNPQTRMKLDALRDATLDKLTKDTSGRVTPETVKLIGGIFHTKFADQKTLGVQRQQLDRLLSQGMHYPILKDYNIPFDTSRFAPSGQSRFQLGAPKQ